LVLGAIFKSIVPDESAEERRELERIVAEAAMPRKKRPVRVVVTPIAGPPQ
jgi:hypothetical protein